MSAIADLVAYDNAGGAHTFNPISVARDKQSVEAHWRESVSGVTDEAQSYVRAKNDALPSGVKKLTVETAVPVMEAIAGQNVAGYTAAPAVAHTLRAVTTFYFSPRARENERIFLRQLHANTLAGRTVTIAAITTGQIPDLIDRLINPT